MKKYILSRLLLFCTTGVSLGSELEQSPDQGIKKSSGSFIKKARKKLSEDVVEFLLKNMKIEKRFLFLEKGSGSPCSLFLIKFNNTNEEFRLTPVSDFTLYWKSKHVDGVKYVAAALSEGERSNNIPTIHCSLEEAQESTKSFSILSDSDLSDLLRRLSLKE